MLTEEQEVLRNTVKDFCEKYLVKSALDIERKGISDDIKQKLAENGFLGAYIPQDCGGSGLDKKSYALMLQEFAGYSPSVAFWIFLNNSIFSELLIKNLDKTICREILEKVAANKATAAVLFEDVLKNSIAAPQLEIDENLSVKGDNSALKIKGKQDYVLNPGADFFIAAVKKGSEDGILLLNKGVSVVADNPHLGFRGIRFSKVVLDSPTKDAVFLSTTNGLDLIRKTYNNASYEVAAIAIGIAKAAVSAAIDYAKTRKTFGSELISFQPIAFSLESYISEIDRMENDLYNSTSPEDLKNALRAKLKAVEMVLNASSLALQVHGGYGYIEDFKIERFYRDSMALAVFTGNHFNDMINLSKIDFGDKSAVY